VDALTGNAIAVINDGASYSLAGRQIAIRADANGVAALTISLNGPVETSRTEREAPYSAFGDINGDYYGMELPAGTYNLHVDALDSNGRVIDMVSVSFTLR
jgi:hypothetical protein